MKTRAIYLAILLVGIVLGGGVVYGHFTHSSPEPVPEAAAPSPPEKKDFLDEARQLSAQNTAPKVEEGTLPPAGADPSLTPAIEVEPAEVLDLGTVSGEAPATGEIKVHNKGKGPLLIANVSTSCGCTKATIDAAKKSVAPDTFSVVTVTVDPKRIPGFESRKTVTITSNDPGKPKVTVDVLTKIDPEFSVEPKELDFGEVQKGTPIEKTMVFRQLAKDPIEILNVKSFARTSDMELSFQKRPEAEWASKEHPEYVITVRLPEDVTPGQLDGRFSITTTCKRLQSYPVTVKAKINSFYTITPPRQLMVRSGVQPGQASTGSATVSADKPIELIDVKSSSEDLTVTTKPGPKPNSIVIEAALKPDVSPGQRNETITFSIKAGDEILKDHLQVRVMSTRPVPPAPPDKPGMPITPGAVLQPPTLPTPPQAPQAPVKPNPPSGALPAAPNPVPVPPPAVAVPPSAFNPPPLPPSPVPAPAVPPTTPAPAPAPAQK